MLGGVGMCVERGEREMEMRTLASIPVPNHKWKM